MFLIHYDRPFEIIGKIIPVTYRLRIPASYGMHPVINIAHLELHKSSPEDMNSDNFNNLPEFEVD
jgi:hypothetical protein